MPAQLEDLYTLELPLGRNMAGSVWRAASKDGSAAIALLDLEDVDDASLKRRVSTRFRRDMGLLRSVSHPNIARVLTVGRSQKGHPYAALELIDGESLDLWAQGEHSGAERVRLASALLTGLEAAHSVGVVHGDLEPGNVLVQEDTPKLIGFGLNRALARESHPGWQRTSGVQRSLAYCAPEQASGGSGRRSDVFGAACLVYLVCTGETPMPGQRVFHDGMPTALGDVLRDGLMVDPEDRPASITAFRSAWLDAVRDSREKIEAAANGFTEVVKAAPKAKPSSESTASSEVESSESKTATESKPSSESKTSLESKPSSEVESSESKTATESKPSSEAPAKASAAAFTEEDLPARRSPPKERAVPAPVARGPRKQTLIGTGPVAKADGEAARPAEEAAPASSASAYSVPSPRELGRVQLQKRRVRGGIVEEPVAKSAVLDPVGTSRREPSDPPEGMPLPEDASGAHERASEPPVASAVAIDEERDSDPPERISLMPVGVLLEEEDDDMDLSKTPADRINPAPAFLRGEDPEPDEDMRISLSDALEADPPPDDEMRISLSDAMPAEPPRANDARATPAVTAGPVEPSEGNSFPWALVGFAVILLGAAYFALRPDGVEPDGDEVEPVTMANASDEDPAVESSEEPLVEEPVAHEPVEEPDEPVVMVPVTLHELAEGARVELDGQTLRTLDGVIEFPGDGEEHELSVFVDGAEPWTRRLATRTPLDLLVVMDLPDEVEEPIEEPEEPTPTMAATTRTATMTTSAMTTSTMTTSTSSATTTRMTTMRRNQLSAPETRPGLARDPGF